MKKKISRQRKLQLKWVAEGRCPQCGEPSRPERQLCERCSKKAAVNTTRWISANKARHLDLMRKWREAHPDYFSNYHKAHK